MARDSDRKAVWDAKARTLINRIDEVLGEAPPAPAQPDLQPQLDALAQRAMLRTPPPFGRIITPGRSADPSRPAPPNMGPQPDRLDHWDAYECRFTDEGDAPDPPGPR
jgi:hypothetical protein